MILSLSSYGADFVWRLDSQRPSSFPDGAFYADPGSIGRLYYAVDSTWISYTFAVTFLVICYMRGTIDGRKPPLTLFFGDHPILTRLHEQKICKFAPKRRGCTRAPHASLRPPGQSSPGCSLLRWKSSMVSVRPRLSISLVTFKALFAMPLLLSLPLTIAILNPAKG